MGMAESFGSVHPDAQVHPAAAEAEHRHVGGVDGEAENAPGKPIVVTRNQVTPCRPC